MKTVISGSYEGKDDGKSKRVFKMTDDPRITRIGKILRQLSLDELPQFINVFRGDMSLVGPRPPLAYEYAVYDLWHRRRVLEVKPGLTGLWQVTGRSRVNFDEMVRLTCGTPAVGRSRSIFESWRRLHAPFVWGRRLLIPWTLFESPARSRGSFPSAVRHLIEPL